MPFVRLSMRRGRTPEQVSAISAAIQRALEAAFDVPPGDCFQAIHQHEPHELVFDPAYLNQDGAPRSDGFLLVAITAGRPRSDAVKAAFYRRLAQELEGAGVAARDTMVVVSMTGPADWSFGDGAATLLAGAPQ